MKTLESGASFVEACVSAWNTRLRISTGLIDLEATERRRKELSERQAEDWSQGDFWDVDYEEGEEGEEP